MSYHHTDRKGAVIRVDTDVLEEMQWHREHEQSAVLYRSADNAALYLRTSNPLGAAEYKRRVKLARRIGKMGGAP